MPGKWNLLSMQPKRNASEPIISKAKIDKTQEKSKNAIFVKKEIKPKLTS